MKEDFGAFSDLAPLLLMLERVRVAGLDRSCRLVWLLPPDVLPGVTAAYGAAIERVDGVEPTLGLRAVLAESEGQQ